MDGTTIIDQEYIDSNMDETMNKEYVYDNEIAPLMSAIIAICQKNKIAMLASFFIPTDDDPTLECTTALLTDTYEPPDELLTAYSIILQRTAPALLAFTIARGDGEQQ